MSDPAENHDLATLRALIRSIDFGILTSIALDGTLHSRPMSTNGDVEFDGDLWFFTYGSAHKVEEIQRNPQVSVGFADPEQQRFVTMSGRAELVRDRGKIEQLWKPSLKAWFPQGTSEPDLALLKVDVERAEYWDAPSSPVARAIAVVKGAPAQAGEHRRLELG